MNNTAIAIFNRLDKNNDGSFFGNLVEMARKVNKKRHYNHNLFVLGDAECETGIHNTIRLNGSLWMTVAEAKNNKVVICVDNGEEWEEISNPITIKNASDVIELIWDMILNIH